MLTNEAGEVTRKMKVKKQKRHRRAVRFYTSCFGFREPFKVLCDGTFVYHLLANRIIPADTTLANILGGFVKIFTTRCVLAELKSLGESYSESLNAASNLIIARCDHDKRKSAVACITEVIGQKNREHFFVATQDAELRKKLQEGNRKSLADKFDYVMQLKLYRISEESSHKQVKADMYVSFGGLLMMLKGDPSIAARFELD